MKKKTYNNIKRMLKETFLATLIVFLSCLLFTFFLAIVGGALFLKGLFVLSQYLFNFVPLEFRFFGAIIYIVILFKLITFLSDVMGSIAGFLIKLFKKLREIEGGQKRK